MGKLHEVLAVEQSLEKSSKKLILESLKTLDKPNLFSGQTKRLVMLDDSEQDLNTEEHVELTTTVDENLDYLAVEVAKYWDVVYQKDKANQDAISDLVVDGQVIAKDVPATTLLGLESKLTQFRDVLNKVPTLTPGVRWEKDETEREGVFRATDPQIQFKTKKDIEFKIVSEATEHHTAQFIEMEQTVNVGKYTTTKVSGMLTPLEKANRIKRLDNLINSVKRARNRANDAKVSNVEIGKVLFSYILDDKVVPVN